MQMKKERIKKAGGHVVFGRVMGSLAVARSLGDRNFKWPYNRAEADFVSPDPFINKLDYIPEYDFLIISCDGLWDKLSYEQAVDFVAAAKKSGKDALETAQLLVKDSLDKGTLDNVTAIVIYLNTPSKDLSGTASIRSKSGINLTEGDDDDDGTEMDVYEYLRLESAKKKKQKEQEFLKLFDLPGQESITQEYKCSLEKKLLYKGIVAITQNFICFASNKPSFGKLVVESISIHDIETIEKKKSLFMFSSSIQITTKDGKKLLLNWKGDTESRDFVFTKLLELISKIDTNSRPTSTNTNTKTEPITTDKSKLQSSSTNSPIQPSKSENNILVDCKENNAPESDHSSTSAYAPNGNASTQDQDNNSTPNSSPESNLEPELKMNFKNWSRFD